MPRVEKIISYLRGGKERTLQMKTRVLFLLLLLSCSCAQPRVSADPGAIHLLRAEQIVVGPVVSVSFFGNIFRILKEDETEKVCMSVSNIIKGQSQSTACFLQFITDKPELRKYTSSPKLIPGVTIVAFLDLVGGAWRPVYDYERAWLELECDKRCGTTFVEDTVRGRMSELLLCCLAGRTREEVEKSLEAAVLRARLYGEEQAMVRRIERLAVGGSAVERQAACSWLNLSKRPSTCVKSAVTP
jgi:hypothetical protein